MAGLRIEGNTSGNVAEVNASNELKVALSSAKLAVDVGAGGTEDLEYPLTSPDRRLAVGLDTLLFSDEWSGSVQNTSLWKAFNSTATISYGVSGWTVINTGSASASTNRCSLETYRTFPYMGRSPLMFECNSMLIDAAVPPTGLNYYLGLGFTNGTSPGNPTEGVFFHYSANGLEGKIANGGSVVATATLIPSGQLQLDVKYKLTMMFNLSRAWFFVNDVLKAVVAVPDGSPHPGQITALPIVISHYNSAAVSGTVSRLKVANVAVYLMDAETSKPWSHVMAGQGMIATQIQNNGTNSGGRLTVWTNNTAPTSTALSNTVNNTGNAKGSGVTGSLGGIYRVQPTLAANTDGILCAFQNPAAGTNVSPLVLHITGIRIQGAVTTVLANTAPVIYSYMVGYGSTAVSLATAESSTINSNTKEPRIIPIGFESYGTNAAVGTVGAGVYMPFNTPIVVNPGEFFHVIARNVGTVTTSGEIQFNVAIDGYYE